MRTFCVKVYLTPEEVERLDRLRGRTSRSSYMAARALAARGLLEAIQSVPAAPPGPWPLSYTYKVPQRGEEEK